MFSKAKKHPRKDKNIRFFAKDRSISSIVCHVNEKFSIGIVNRLHLIKSIRTNNNSWANDASGELLKIPFSLSKIGDGMQLHLGTNPHTLRKQPKRQTILLVVRYNCTPKFNSFNSCKVKSDARISFPSNFLSNAAMLLSSKFIYSIL